MRSRKKGILTEVVRDQFNIQPQVQISCHTVKYLLSQNILLCKSHKINISFIKNRKYVEREIFYHYIVKNIRSPGMWSQQYVSKRHQKSTLKRQSLSEAICSNLRPQIVEQFLSSISWGQSLRLWSLWECISAYGTDNNGQAPSMLKDRHKF